MKEIFKIQTAKSVFDIDTSWFATLGILAVVVDLDNTLDSPFAKMPSPRVTTLREELFALGITLIVVSNNRKKRVLPYLTALKVPGLWNADKIFPHRIKAFLARLSLRPQDCLFVGDQLLTDGTTARKLKARFVLTESLTPEDNWVGHLTRSYNTRKRARYQMQGKFGAPCPQKGSHDHVLH
jgi:uncharacterized protein